MARKILLDGDAGPSGGAVALLLLVPLAIVMFGSRRRRGQISAPVSRRSRDDAPRREGKPEPPKTEPKKTDDKKSSGTKSRSAVKHHKKEEDESHAKYQQKNPDNPFYKQHAAPEGYNPDKIDVKPVRFPAASDVKGAHHPYDPKTGRILPRDQKAKGVHFINPDDPSHNAL